MEKILPAIINIDGKPVVSVALTQILNCYDNIFTSALNTCQTNIVLCGGGHGAGYRYRSFYENLAADIQKNEDICPNELAQKLQLMLQTVDPYRRENNYLRESITDLIQKSSRKNLVLSMNFSGYGDYDYAGVENEINNQLINKFSDASTNFRNGNLNVLIPNSNRDIARLENISKNLAILFSNNNLPNEIDKASLDSINHNFSSSSYLMPTDYLITNYIQSLFTAVMLTYLPAKQNIRYRIFANINILITDSLNNAQWLGETRDQNLFEILISRIFNGIEFLQTPDYSRIEELTSCICNNILGQAEHVTQVDFIVLDKTERTIADGFIDNEGHFFVPYSSILKNSELTEMMQQILNDLEKLEQESTTKKIDILLENMSNNFTQENLMQTYSTILVPDSQYIETLVNQRRISYLTNQQLKEINFSNLTDENIIEEIIKNSNNQLSNEQIITIFEKRNINLIIAIITHDTYVKYLTKIVIDNFDFEGNFRDIIENLVENRNEHYEITEQKLNYIEWLLENNRIFNENIALFNSLEIYFQERLIKLFTSEQLENPQYQNLQHMIKYQLKQVNITNLNFSDFNPNHFDIQYIIEKLSGEQIHQLNLSNIEILKFIIENNDESVKRRLINGLSDEQLNQIDINNYDVLAIIFSCDDLIEKFFGEQLNDNNYITNKINNVMSYHNIDEEFIMALTRNVYNEQYINRHVEEFRNWYNRERREKIAINLSKKIVQHIDFTQINDIEISKCIISCRKKFISKEQILRVLNGQNTELIDYLVFTYHELENFPQPEPEIVRELLYENFDDECYLKLNLNNLNIETIFYLIYYCSDRLSDKQIHQIDISQFYNWQINFLRPIFPFQKLSKEQIQRIDFDNLYRNNDNMNNLIDFYSYSESYFAYLKIIIENLNGNLLETQISSLVSIIIEAKNITYNLNARFIPILIQSINELIISLIQNSYSRYLPQDIFNDFIYSSNETKICNLNRISYDKLSDGQRQQIEERIHFYLRDLNNLPINSAFRLILNLGKVSFDEGKQFKFSYRETGCIIELLKLEQEADSLFCFSDFFCDFKGNGFLKSLYNGGKNTELNEFITPNILKQIVCLKARDCYGSKKGMKIVRKLRSYFSKLPQDYKNGLNQINEIDLMDKETMLKKGSGFIKQICQGDANHLIQDNKKNELFEILNQKILSYSLEKQTKILQHFKDNAQNIHQEILSHLSAKFNVEFPQYEITHQILDIN